MSGRRLAHRAIWAGMRRRPNVIMDPPTIAVEFVSGSPRDRLREYVDKRGDYRDAGIGDYWIVDRFQRTMTVIINGRGYVREQVIEEFQRYETPRLPGFSLPVAEILSVADQCVQID